MSGSTEATRTLRLSLPQMDCPQELALVERALAGVAGVTSLEPDYLQRQLTLRLERSDSAASEAAESGAAAGEAEILRRIRAAGLAARVLDEATGLPQPHGTAESATALNVLTDGERPERWRQLLTAVSAALVALALVVAWQSSGGWSRAASVASIVVSLAWLVPMAWRAVRLRAIDMHVLMTLAGLGGVWAGESLEAATALVLFGWSLDIERAGVARAGRAVAALARHTVSVAHRVRRDDADRLGPTEAGVSGATEETVPPEALQVGDRIRVRPGERVPADAVVVAGSSLVDEAQLTGESRPLEKHAGDALLAGSLNGAGLLEAEVQRPAAESTVARIERLVAAARSQRGTTQRLVDEFARYYTPAVVVCAIAVAGGVPLARALGWSGGDGATNLDWFQRGLVLLVVACPCALVVSTPVTTVSLLARGARQGLLIKGATALEAMGRIRRLVFDKTGTLTTGRPRLSGVAVAEGETERELLQVAASLEQHSQHPLAAAIVEAATERGLQLREVSGFQAHGGQGVSGEMAGGKAWLGRAELLPVAARRALTASGRESGNGDARDAVAQVALGERWLGTLTWRDEPRDEAREALGRLRRLGIERMTLLTGDHAAAAGELSRELGLDAWQADLLPEQKLSRLREHVAECPWTAMVGDGVNDAPALAAAPVGISFGTGASDTAMETADIVIAGTDLRRLPQLVALGQGCRRRLAENIALALGIKLAVLLAAAAGWGTMWLAVAADVGASLLVIANGLRSVRLD